MIGRVSELGGPYRLQFAVIVFPDQRFDLIDGILQSFRGLRIPVRMQRDNVHVLEPSELEHFLNPTHRILRSDNTDHRKIRMIGFDRFIRFLQQLIIIFRLRVGRTIPSFAESAIKFVVRFRSDKLVFILVDIRFRIVRKPFPSFIGVWSGIVVIEGIVETGNEQHIKAGFLQHAHVVVRHRAEGVHSLRPFDPIPFDPVPDRFGPGVLNERDHISLPAVQMRRNTERRLLHRRDIEGGKHGE
ncbi:hypothetical protein D3C78_787590 [compost metagenome]